MYELLVMLMVHVAMQLCVTLRTGYFSPMQGIHCQAELPRNGEPPGGASAQECAEAGLLATCVWSLPNKAHQNEPKYPPLAQSHNPLILKAVFTMFNLHNMQ